MNYKKWINKIFRLKNVRESRYKKICLDKNERIVSFKKNIFKKLISKINSESFNYYPETWNLYKALSRLHRININQIFLTAGIDGAIKNCFELFVNKGSRVIVLKPTFAMVDIYCKIFGAKKITINYDKKIKLNVEYLIKSIKKNISLIVIANPNSPTGTLISKSNMKKIIKKANSVRVPVVVDEAYYGFTNTTVLPLVKKYKNLIICRTFSKAYGLAGLRVGYTISNSEIAKLLYNLKPMYEVNSVGAMMSEILLQNSHIHKKYIQETKNGLRLLLKYLKDNKILFIKTHTNFIYININKKINLFYKDLLKNGILTKVAMGIRGYENYLRITLGPPKQMKLIISKLKKFSN